ncbi:MULTISPECIES: hypothetical protein [Acinetobacter]
MAHHTVEAISILKRIPVHMIHSITLLDRTGDWAAV